MTAVIARILFVVDAEVAGVPPVVVIAGSLPAAGRSAAPRVVRAAQAPRRHVILGRPRNSASMSAGPVNITALLIARQGRCLYDFPLIRANSRRCHFQHHLSLSLFLLSSLFPSYHQMKHGHVKKWLAIVRMPRESAELDRMTLNRGTEEELNPTNSFLSRTKRPRIKDVGRMKKGSA